MMATTTTTAPAANTTTTTAAPIELSTYKTEYGQTLYTWSKPLDLCETRTDAAKACIPFLVASGRALAAMDEYRRDDIVDLFENFPRLHTAMRALKATHPSVDLFFQETRPTTTTDTDNDDVRHALRAPLQRALEHDLADWATAGDDSLRAPKLFKGKRLLPAEEEAAPGHHSAVHRALHDGLGAELTVRRARTAAAAEVLRLAQADEAETEEEMHAVNDARRALGQIAHEAAAYHRVLARARKTFLDAVAAPDTDDVETESDNEAAAPAATKRARA